MSEWDFSIFNEKLGNKTDYGVIVGNDKSTEYKEKIDEDFRLSYHKSRSQ